MDNEEFFFLFQIDEMIERMNKAIEKKHTYHLVSVVSSSQFWKIITKLLWHISDTYTQDKL